MARNAKPPGLASPGANDQIAAGVTDRVQSNPPTAREVIDLARSIGPVAPYRSPAYELLPFGHPHRRAAELIAAECWHTTSVRHQWGRGLLVEELLTLAGAGLVAADAAARVPLAAAVRAGRELAEHFRRVDLARAAGSDYGLARDERRRLARQPRPGDRVGPVTNADRSRAWRSFAERATREVA